MKETLNLTCFKCKGERFEWVQVETHNYLVCIECETTETEKENQ